ncbi:hypothetical protein HY256_07170 [Candidatus Sumerlaeota bacterium]|nr:hypothetical protein [Candidatus Sumerlaeota bacterium]
MKNFKLRFALWLPAILGLLILASCGQPAENNGGAAPASDPSAAAGSRVESRSASASRRAPADPVVERRRKAIPGGQVILADDPALANGKGWAQLDYDPNFEARITCWTEGDEQTLDWEGPETPGDYTIRANFYRPHPFPEEKMTIQYRFPGDSEMKSIQAGLNGIIIEGKVTTKVPHEKLHAEFKIPSWVPSERIPGSKDPRKLGVIFVSLELAPFVPPAPPGAASPAAAVPAEEKK